MGRSGTGEGRVARLILMRKKTEVSKVGRRGKLGYS